MTDEKDIWQSAATMIDLHGDNAALEAGLIGDQLLDKGDVEGQRLWIFIVIAIEELQRTEPERKAH